MSRIKVEHGISYDQARDRYYVYMDGGTDDNGRRVRRYKTYPTLTLARRGQRAFLGEREAAKTVTASSMTLDQWLEYWMDNVVVPGRAETTAYGYRKIIENHLSPALGDIPVQRLTPSASSSTTPPSSTRRGSAPTPSGGTTTCCPPPSTRRCGRTCSSAPPPTGWSPPGRSPTRPGSTPRRI